MKRLLLVLVLALFACDSERITEVQVPPDTLTIHIPPCPVYVDTVFVEVPADTVFCSKRNRKHWKCD